MCICLSFLLFSLSLFSHREKKNKKTRRRSSRRILTVTLWAMGRVRPRYWPSQTDMCLIKTYPFRYVTHSAPTLIQEYLHMLSGCRHSYIASAALLHVQSWQRLLSTPFARLIIPNHCNASRPRTPPFACNYQPRVSMSPDQLAASWTSSFLLAYSDSP